MSGPITWRQLAAPNMADAARPMEYARQSLNAGFEGLQKTLDFYNQSYKENQDKDQAMKALAVQELLQTAKTPEQVAGLQPQLQALTAAITEPKYRKEVLGAQDSRAAFLRDALVKDWQYQDQNQARENRPITNTIQMHLANGDLDQAKYVAGAYADRLNNAGEIFQGIKDSGRKDLEWGEKQKGWQRADNAETRAQEEEKRRVAMHPYAVTQAQLNNETTYANLQETIGKMAQGNTPSIANLERLASIQRDGESRLSSMDDRIGSPAVQEKLFKTIKERFGGDKDTAEKVISQVRGLVSNPAYKDLRFDDAVRLATGTDTSTAWYRPGNGRRLASEVDAFMQTPEYGARGVELSTNMAKAGEEFKREMAAATAALGQDVRPGVGYQPLDPRFSNLARPSAGPAPVYQRPQTPSWSADKNVNMNGYSDETLFRLDGLSRDLQALTGKPLTVTSGYRTNEKQAQLYDDYKNGKSPYPAAPPGKSKHNAVDVGAIDADGAQLAAAAKAGLLEKWGFHRPVKGDPVHLELNPDRKPIEQPQLNLPKPTPVAATPAAIQAPAPKKEQDLAKQALLQEQVQLETDEIRAKVRGKYSPEAQKYIDEARKTQLQADRETIKKAGKSFDTAVNTGVGVAEDLFTFPVRAAANAYNGVAGLARVGGADLPQITDPILTDYFGYTKSRQTGNVNPDPELLKRRRASLESRLEQEAAKTKKK